MAILSLFQFRNKIIQLGEILYGIVLFNSNYIHK